MHCQGDCCLSLVGIVINVDTDGGRVVDVNIDLAILVRDVDYEGQSGFEWSVVR